MDTKTIHLCSVPGFGNTFIIYIFYQGVKNLDLKSSAIRNRVPIFHKPFAEKLVSFMRHEDFIPDLKC